MPLRVSPSMVPAEAASATITELPTPPSMIAGPVSGPATSWPASETPSVSDTFSMYVSPPSIRTVPPLEAAFAMPSVTVAQGSASPQVFASSPVSGSTKVSSANAAPGVKQSAAAAVAAAMLRRWRIPDPLD